MASGWSPAGSMSVTRSKWGTRREYRCGETVMFPNRGGGSPDGAAGGAAARRSSSVQISAICFCSWGSSPALSTTQVATFRRSSSVACSPMRRRASSRGTPRASRRSRRVSSGASTTMTHAYSNPRFDSTSSGTSWITTASGGASATRRQEFLADRRVRDRLQLLARRVVDERDGRERGPVERSVRLQDLGPEAFDELGEGRRPGFDDLTRDPVGVDHHRAPLREHLGHRRLPRADPARQPDHQHGPRFYEPPFARNCWRQNRAHAPFRATVGTLTYLSGT